MRKIPAVPFAVLALCSLSLSAFSADGFDPASAFEPRAALQGSLRGTVRTSDGAVLPHVAVVLRGERSSARVATGPDGSYRVPRLAFGEYHASVDAPGLELKQPAKTSVAGGEARLDLVLSPAPLREHLLVSATRGEAAASTLGVSTDVLERERIEERQASSLLGLVQDLPGVATARSGGTGLQASAFLRGGESRYARVLVDGVPVNQPGGAFDFGTALPFEIERIEVVRGAASSLYGSDALAGVISLTTRRAGSDEGPSLRVEGEGGRFDWQRYSAATSGSWRRLDWNAGGQRLRTDNAEPNSTFTETSLALSAGLRLDPRTEGRAVVRVEDASVGTPGPTAFGRPDLDAAFERRDLVASASLHRGGTVLAQQLGVAFARTNQISLDPIDSGTWFPTWQGRSSDFPLSDFPDPDGFLNRSARLAASYQAERSLGTRQLLAAGGEAEHETGAVGSRGGELLRPSRTNLGLYLQDRVLLGSRAYLTVGGRVERNGSYGIRAVPRAALAFRARGGDDATTLRASAGMGIKEPSLSESFGSLFTRANPDLDPERSRTFDLGIEQRLLASRFRAAVTAFDHEYRDQIAYLMVDPTSEKGGMFVNLAWTRSRGLEASLEARPIRALWLSGQYTLQHGEILESPSDFDPAYQARRPLLRRPRHQASGSAVFSFARGSVGATLVRVGARADSDFLGLGLANDPGFRNPGYTRLDARARLRLTGSLETLLAGENLTDERYQEVLGYPALGRSLRGGLRLSVGRR